MSSTSLASNQKSCPSIDIPYIAASKVGEIVANLNVIYVNREQKYG
jgi:hypothetical protein